MKYRWILITLLFLLMVGCASEPEATPLPAETSTVTATITPTATLRILGTRTRIPTEIPDPTLTAKTSPTLEHTRTPYPTSTLPPFPTPKNSDLHRPESISPSEKWIAWRVSCEEDLLYACFQFINKEGSHIWHFPEDSAAITGNSLFYISGSVVHWSGDNKFVYMVTRPDVWEVHFSPVFGIIKFSLVTGVYSHIITPNFPKDFFSDPLLVDLNFYEFGFSNNSQWLAYAIKNKHSIDFTLLDLYSRETKSFSVLVNENSLFGDIVWSPNDRVFVFSVAEHMTGLDTSDDFSVFRVTIDDLSVKRIYPHGDLFLYSSEWESNKELRYSYLDQDTKSGEVLLNIETGELTEVQ